MKKGVICLFFCLVLLGKISAQNKIAPLRGTWITNVASDALRSQKDIYETIQICKKAKINNVFVVVWNGGVTMYPSKVMEEFIGIKQSKAYMHRDPLQEIIEAGHAAGIKVHAWFEFGFSYSYKDSNSLWAKRYPDWLGRDIQGKALQKNGFFWWNALNPEVQNFMTKLVLEVVNTYDIDGVQGDDRLPAMPGEGGYDQETLKLYASAHHGDLPPADSKDRAWIQWRADQLSAYAQQLFQSVKSAKASCIVSWAPGIYPWSKEQYLQDWPAWLNGGYADYVFPQLYRYNIESYEKILKELDGEVTPLQKKKIFPGILTSLGNGYLVNQNLLYQMIQLNRKYGFEGECMFYFESLKKLSNIY